MPSCLRKRKNDINFETNLHPSAEDIRFHRQPPVAGRKTASKITLHSPKINKKLRLKENPEIKLFRNQIIQKSNYSEIKLFRNQIQRTS